MVSVTVDMSAELGGKVETSRQKIRRDPTPVVDEVSFVWWNEYFRPKIGDSA